jgi:hypothetical protein
MQNTNKVLALIALGLAFEFAGAATTRAQETGQAVPLAAASAVPEIANSTPESPANALDNNNTPGNMAPAGSTACWKQAGLSKDVMAQRRSIVSKAKARIRSVESDATLTPPQQRQQIRQIRMNARQDVNKLLTPDQQAALRQCREERAAERTGSGTGSAPQGAGNDSGNAASAPDSSTNSPQPK